MVIGVVSIDSNRINAFRVRAFKNSRNFCKTSCFNFKNYKHLEIRLEQKNKIQQVLDIEISKIITSSLDLDEIFSTIMATIERSLN